MERQELIFSRCRVPPKLLYPMYDDTITIDYSWVEISGQRMLLPPVRTTMQAGSVMTRRSLVGRQRSVTTASTRPIPKKGIGGEVQ